VQCGDARRARLVTGVAVWRVVMGKTRTKLAGTSTLYCMLPQVVCSGFLSAAVSILLLFFYVLNRLSAVLYLSVIRNIRSSPSEAYLSLLILF
jgi:hypothetical protein